MQFFFHSNQTISLKIRMLWIRAIIRVQKSGGKIFKYFHLSIRIKFVKQTSRNIDRLAISL